MITIYDFYAKLKKHIGQGGAVFRKFCGLSSSAPYCNAYVCYGFYENGVAGLYYGGKKVTYCPTSIKWCQANLAQVPMYLAMKDDPIYFDWNNNNVPDHIGFVKEPISTDKISTHEGNTNGGIVAEKTRPVGYVLGIFRPHFKPSALPTGDKCTVDGRFGYDSIYFLQKSLGIKADGILGKDTVKALQKKAGCDPDGAWGKTTSKKVQKMIGATADGAFGEKSVKALQKWINKQNSPSESVTTPSVVVEETSTKTNAQLIGDMALELSWATNTPKSQWNYSYSKTKKWTKWSQLGKAKPKKKCMEAMDKYMKDHWAKGSAKYGYGGRVCASCDKFVGLVIRATGVNKSMPSTLDEFYKGKGFGKFEKVKTGGKKSKMKHGDVIVYKRKSGGGHTLIVAEHNGTKLGCQAGLNHYFPRRKKLTNYDLSDYKKFDVWRAK